MNSRIFPNMLGATLYMPANRSDLSEVILDNKIPGLRSLVICLEDALNESDIPEAYRNITRLAEKLTSRNGQQMPLVFIRPRSIQMAEYLIKHIDLTGFTGLVLPKFVMSDLDAWWSIIKETNLQLMPTLETREVFDATEMLRLADALEIHEVKSRIVALRIGGNDLMSLLSLRRSRTLTVYDSPMGYVIKMLVAVFGSRGFSLTAPVCELISDQSLLQKELELDVAHGLVGKTAIHPVQIPVIEEAFAIKGTDVSEAIKILTSTQAVFSSQGAMCEPATHRKWAQATLAKHAISGNTLPHAAER